MPDSPQKEPSTQQPRKERTDPAPFLQRLVERQVIMPSERILCYGCGRGADVAWLRMRKFKSVSGYDPYPPFGYTIEPRGYHDWVGLIYLMRRLKTDKNRQETIRSALNLVRPGGRLLIISRNWRRMRPEGPHESREAAVDYLKEFLAGADIAAWEAPVYDPGDPELGFIAQKAGVHKPKRPVEFVADPGRAAAVCAELMREPMVGLDVETTLDEPRQLCTVQLGTREKTYILDALALTDLAPLKAVMESTAVEKVIHNAAFEEQMLGAHGIRIKHVYDTLTASRRKHKNSAESGHKLGEVCERELQIYLDKALQTSDWTQRPLTPEQLDYAALDAEVLIDLYEVFHPPKPPETMTLF